MIVKYVRRKNNYEIVNVRALSKALDHLKTAQVTNLDNKFEIKQAFEIIKNVVPFDEKIGVLVGFEEEGVIYIGYSKCMTNVEEFDKEFGKALAINRAIAFEEKYNQFGVPEVPYIIAKELPEFVDRCLRYYKDKRPSEWVVNYLTLDQFNE